MPKILITGGAGFIGSHLAQFIINLGYKTRIIDNLSPQIHGSVPKNLQWLESQNVDFMRGSILNRRDVEVALEGITNVVHLAAETGTGQSMYEISKYNNTNTQGLAVLLDVLSNQTNHTVQNIVLTSSRSVYGEGAYVCSGCNASERVFPNPRTFAMLQNHEWQPRCPKCNFELDAVASREDDLTKPISIYAATKLAQEDLVRIACGSLGINYSILRLQNVYGEYQSLNNPYTGILSIFSTKIRRGADLPIFEDGFESRDFVHVEDVCRAIYSCITTNTPINGVVNVGTGSAVTIIDVAEKLNTILNGQSKIVITGNSRIGDIRHNFADIQKLMQINKGGSQIDLEVGLTRFANWVLTQPLPNDMLNSANNELKVRRLLV